MIKEINKSLEPKANYLLQHPLNKKINTPDQLKIFMEYHIFTGWAFMSLLQALQEKLTKTTSPWVPVGDPELRYLINELVLTEESDLNFYGKHQSHFEMYQEALKAAGANTSKIREFLSQVKHGTDIYLIIATSDLPISIKKFLKRTFEVISEGKPHNIASAFTFGHQYLIPKTFTALIQNVQKKFPNEDLNLFRFYFERHIIPEDDLQNSLAYKMLEHICDKDAEKWTEAEETALNTLDSGIQLWDGIEKEISHPELIQ